MYEIAQSVVERARINAVTSRVLMNILLQGISEVPASFRRRHRTGVEHLALSARKEIPALLEQLARRPGEGHEDVWLLHHRFLEAATYFLPHRGAALGIDRGKEEKCYSKNLSEYVRDRTERPGADQNQCCASRLIMNTLYRRAFLSAVTSRH